MALGFGKVNPQDWDKVRTGSSADMVPAGDYFAVLKGIRHIEPKEGKPLGMYVLEFVTTEDNVDAALQGKQIEARINYCGDMTQAPADKIDGWGKMNDMSLTKMANVIEAAGAEPAADAEGNLDLVTTLGGLPQMQPKLLLEVIHETYLGRQQQDCGNFRPVSG
jgi:hypothetical protein